jgi:hypothetical protein
MKNDIRKRIRSSVYLNATCEVDLSGSFHFQFIDIRQFNPLTCNMPP